MNKSDILGVEFSEVSEDLAVSYTIEQIKDGNKGYVVTPNPEMVYLCKKDQELKNILNSAILVLPDGVGVVYASRILKKGIFDKVAGIDYASGLISQLEKNNMSLFLIGGKPGVAQKARDNLLKAYVNLNIVGVEDGYFRDEDEVISRINGVGGADVVFVCIGAPRQEKFMQRHIGDTNCKIMCGLGGSLDVFSGEVKRAPKVFVNLGLEWFYRLLCQPQRIVRAMRLPMFMLDVFIYKIKNKEA